jgi:hypothetical protein
MWRVTRLMGGNEEGTHERLKTHLRESVEPKIAEHRGRVVKHTGDADPLSWDFLTPFRGVFDGSPAAAGTRTIPGPGHPESMKTKPQEAGGLFFRLRGSRSE